MLPNVLDVIVQIRYPECRAFDLLTIKKTSISWLRLASFSRFDDRHRQLDCYLSTCLPRAQSHAVPNRKSLPVCLS